MQKFLFFSFSLFLEKTIFSEDIISTKDNFLNVFHESDYGLVELCLYVQIFFVHENTEPLNTALAEIICGIDYIIRRQNGAN